jgi:hypothetical protein
VKVVVIGAGAAGTAAAWALARAGVDTTVVHDRPGATALSSGAIDREPWEQAARPKVVDGDLLLLSTELGWVIGPDFAQVATPAGVARPARGRDLALLDLAELAGKRIAVVDELFAGWDGILVARALADSPWARSTGTTFEAVPVSLRVVEAEREFSSYDVALLFDEPKRFERLCALLREAQNGFDAWLTGPWLGVTTDVAERARQALGVPIGETTSPPGGPAGARFERMRGSVLEQAGAKLVCGRVSDLAPDGSGFRVELEEEALSADGVVLAIGGVAVDGIRLDGPPHLPAGDACFRTSLNAPVELELDGAPLDQVSSMYGVDLSIHGLGLLERVGIAADGVAARGAPGVFVAGDCLAGRPRTVLEALRAGLAAARMLVG